MKIVRASPFLCPDPSSVQAGPWFNGDQELENGVILPTWDSSTSLSVTRMVELDIGLLGETAKLPLGTRVALVSAWWSPGTGLRGKGEEIVISVGKAGKTQIEISIVLPGDQLRTSVQIRTSLVFIDRPAGALRDPLSASRIGSILWRDETSLVLEGDASRFPMTVADFADNNLGEPSACWRLDWNPRDLEAAAMACFRLWINKRHTIFHQAVISQAPKPEESAIRSAFKFSVAAEMLQMALGYADELEQGAFDPGSSGEVFNTLIDQFFPGLSAVETKELQQRDPSAFSTAIQARSYLFSNPLDADR